MWPLASTTLVVQHLRPEPVPLDHVPGDHGVAGNGKSLLERHGIAVVTGGTGRTAAKLVHLTPYGEQIRSHHAPYVAAVEDAWRARFGADVVDRLRTTLEGEPAAAAASLPDHVVAPLHLG
jgi:2-C-methyl-D-erythritol 4-phosphate cytidylyltransferase